MAATSDRNRPDCKRGITLDEEMTNVIKLIWKLDRLLLLPITHRPDDGCHTPREWAKHVKMGSWQLVDHPWLWCGCGDSFETWQELKQRTCHNCEVILGLRER